MFNNSGLQQTNKISTTQPTAQILYRQQPSRNQIKILQAQPGQSTSLVNTSGAINIVPTSQAMQGQKVAVASVSAPGTGGQPTQSIVTSVATVQVTPGQVRPQFIKQVGTKVGRADNEMLLLKRQVLTAGGQHKQQQLIPQATQIFTPTNIQVQQQTQSQNTQVSSSGNAQVNVGQQQQIATIVKTSTGNPTSLAGASGMISQIKPSGQIKVTMGNQTQMRSLQLQQQPIYQRKVGKYSETLLVEYKYKVNIFFFKFIRRRCDRSTDTTSYPPCATRDSANNWWSNSFGEDKSDSCVLSFATKYKTSYSG